MALKIGINENVYLKSAVLNDKNTLELEFAEQGDGPKPKTQSFFDTVGAEGVVEIGGPSGVLRIFPPLPPREDSDKTPEKKVELVSLDINRTKSVLLHLLRGYYTLEELKAADALALDLFRGIEMDRDNYNTKILNKEVLTQVHANMCNKFIQLITPHLNNPEKLFRLLLVRQSKEKHYSTFRGRYVEENPFFESMAVPKEQSAVKFTAYELKEGLDNDAPYQKPASDGSGGTGGNAAPVDAKSVFG